MWDLAQEVVRRLDEGLDDELTGAYLSGSVALGDFSVESSDIDLFAVVEGHLDTRRRTEAVNLLLDPSLDIPARGLEFVLYERAAVAAPSPEAAFSVNLNTGPRMPLRASIDPSEEPAHWFVLDRSIVRERGIVVVGPKPPHLFATIPRPWVLEALRQSLDWHSGNDRAGFNSVLNAARGLNFVRRDGWVSKTEAAEWAVREVGHEDVIRSALSSRRGEPAELDREEVAVFLDLVQAEVDRSLE